MAPTGGELGAQNADVITDLNLWTRRNGRGKVFDSNTKFVLTKRLKLVPDAAWASKERIYAIPYEQRTAYIPIIPEFVIEIWSKLDRYSKLQDKMQRYINRGVELGWLMHPKLREVKIYTAVDIGTIQNPSNLRGTGPVKGFVLNLEPVWFGLQDPLSSRPARKKK
jgi:Uma2 family endonuclease